MQSVGSQKKVSTPHSLAEPAKSTKVSEAETKGEEIKQELLSKLEKATDARIHEKGMISKEEL